MSKQLSTRSSFRSHSDLIYLYDAVHMPHNKYPWTNEVLMSLLDLIKIQNYDKKDAYLDVKNRLLNIWQKSGLELISE